MQYMFRFRWGAQFVLTFHLTSSLPISVFTRRLLQVRIIGCLTFGRSSAFIIGSCSLPIVANVQCSVGQILELLEQSIYIGPLSSTIGTIGLLPATHYWSRSALEQMRGRWHSLEWSPLILCLQSSAATSIDRCVQHWALRVMCVVLWSCGHLFSSVFAAMLPYCGRSSRSHNKRNPKNRLIVNQRWLRALKDELLQPRPLCNKGNAEDSAGTSWLLRGTCARGLPRVGRVSFALRWTITFTDI